MKRFIFLSILLGAALVSHAQGFEWVQTYTGPEVTSGVTTNQIVGSCVDSMGNIYILGEFSPGAFLCGERLLPSEIITTPIKRAVVIAKLSPSGELLWHKAIYNGNKIGCYAYAIRMLGDSNIMAMVTMYLPYDNGYGEYMNLYYLDTLLSGNNDYLIPTDSVNNHQTAFITFDFEGNVTEQHFVCRGFADLQGNKLTPRFTRGADLDNLITDFLSGEDFNIDADGNIYVIRSVHTDYVRGPQCDTCEGGFQYYYGVDNGTIGAMIIIVDGIHTLTYPISCRSSLWNQQIMKFSHNFDSLIDAVYIFDTTLFTQQSGGFNVHSFEVDNQSNIYVSMEGRSDTPSGLRIANSDSINLGDRTSRPTWILKYNSNLDATGLIQLSYTVLDSSNWTPQLLLMYPHIDDRTNSLFVPGLVSWLNNVPIDKIFYNSDTLDLLNNSSFWLRLDLNDFSLISYGMTRPGVDSKGSVPTLTTSNNRVFAQLKYLHSMIFMDTTWYTDPSSWDMAFIAWDYSGHDIGLFARYGLSSPSNVSYLPITIDSIVYLMGSLWQNAHFDTIETHNYGNSQAFIAKYVDPEFARPYVHPSDRQEQAIDWNQILSFSIANSPITLIATSTSGLPVTYSCSDSSIAYVRGDTLHLVAEGYAWLTATQDGNYQYLPAEPVQRLLTVGGVGIASVGADGQAKAYPNPTTGRVTIDLGEIPPAPPLPYHQPHPYDSRDVNMVLYTSPGAPFPQYETSNFPYHQRYNMKVSGPGLQSHDGVVTAWLTDMQGRREEVVLSPTGPDQYTLDLTSRPPAAYLLTVTTADGRDLTFRLVKQYGQH